MKTIEASNAWFSFKGRRNTDPDLMARMLGMPVRPHPERKGEYVPIIDMDGELWVDHNGYERILVTVPCLVPDNDNIDAVSAWLSGSGDLIFGDEPNRAYHARITKEFARTNRAQRLRGQEFTIPFDCEPYRYSADPENDMIHIISAIDSITNPGTADSLPLITVNGNGDGAVMIGRNTLLFDSVTEPVHVDCAAKIAYTGDGSAENPMLLATQHVSGEWMRIAPGESNVTLTGGITSVSIAPRWRWL